MYSGNHGVVHECETIFALIRETRHIPQLCFCFVGEGAWKHKLMETAKAESWQHVVFLPYQPKTLLQSSLSAADVHLVSLRAEMEGLSIPSKMYGVLAAGRPVIFIGPSRSEAALVVREADCGYVVAPGDIQGAVGALLAGYHNRLLLEKQGGAARRYFDTRFDRSIATERFRQVLQHMSSKSASHVLPVSAVSPPSRSQ
jgi:glycosyltransferase involved in cell wall biosynthesis